MNDKFYVLLFRVASTLSKRLNIADVLKTVLAKATEMKNDTIVKNAEYMNSSIVLASKSRYAKSEMRDKIDFRKQLQCCLTSTSIESV